MGAGRLQGQKWGRGVHRVRNGAGPAAGQQGVRYPLKPLAGKRKV